MKKPNPKRLNETFVQGISEISILCSKRRVELRVRYTDLVHPKETKEIVISRTHRRSYYDRYKVLFPFLLENLTLETIIPPYQRVDPRDVVLLFYVKDIILYAIISRVLEIEVSRNLPGIEYLPEVIERIDEIRNAVPNVFVEVNTEPNFYQLYWEDQEEGFLPVNEFKKS